MTYNFSPDVLKLNPELANLKTEPASKYRNVRAEAKGLRFQSGKEAAGVGKLIILDEKHLIFGLRLQVKFPLPGQTSYIADAVYLKLEPSHEAGNNYLVPVVMDFKGFKTKEYRLKKKLFAERYGQGIEEF